MLNEIIDMKLTEIYVVRISELGDDASFMCPQCGNIISPNDFSDIAYTIESVFLNDKSEGIVVVIFCKCGYKLLLDLNTSFPEMDSIMRM